MAGERRGERHDEVAAFETLNAEATYLTSPTEGTFKGTASAFGSIARGAKGPTKFAAGAFRETLAECNGRLPLLYQHAQDKPVGVLHSIRETPNGLEVAGKISMTTFGRDLVTLMKDGAVTGLSIGFDALETGMPERHSSGEMVRIVNKARLHEISLVTFPADRSARIEQVHKAACATDPSEGEEDPDVSEGDEPVDDEAIDKPKTLHSAAVAVLQNWPEEKREFLAEVLLACGAEAEPDEALALRWHGGQVSRKPPDGRFATHSETLGDFPGHPFRGNQHGPGEGGGGSTRQDGHKEAMSKARGPAPLVKAHALGKRIEAAAKASGNAKWQAIGRRMAASAKSVLASKFGKTISKQGGKYTAHAEPASDDADLKALLRELEPVLKELGLTVADLESESMSASEVLETFMACPECGEDCGNDANYCPNCGEKLSASSGPEETMAGRMFSEANLTKMKEAWAALAEVIVKADPQFIRKAVDAMGIVADKELKVWTPGDPAPAEAASAAMTPEVLAALAAAVQVAEAEASIRGVSVEGLGKPFPGAAAPFGSKKTEPDEETPADEADPKDEPETEDDPEDVADGGADEATEDDAPMKGKDEKTKGSGMPPWLKKKSA